jgi:DNA repair exonuclease SbcCD ATPase subunit
MQEPPRDPRPTESTRPLGVEREVVPAEREIALDPELAEKIDSASFWSKVGSAIAVLAAIIGVIALFLAIDAGNDDSGSSNAGLRDDVNQLQSDVNRLERQTSSADQANQDTQDVESQLSDMNDQLKQISDDQQQQAQDISSLQQDLKELTDRVDQVEQAQEQAAGGGP